MQGKKIVYIVIALLAVMALFFVPTYNGLVKKDEQVKLQWNEVQNVYQRRLDLVPNLVQIVKGGADYEQTTLQKIAAARAAAASGVTSNAYDAQTKAQNEVATATNRLLINVENYPDLQGTRAFKDLQVQLEGTERRVKFARKDFNAAIATYNSSVRSFPTSIASKLFGFASRDGFTSDAGAENAVEINFKK